MSVAAFRVWGGGDMPGQVSSPSQSNMETQDKQPCAHTHTLLTNMFVDCERRLEYPERICACTGRTCDLQLERAQDG